MAAVYTSIGNGHSTLDLKHIDTSMNEDSSVYSVQLVSPTSPLGIARPPTPGGGPLSSHPATPITGDSYGSYFPSSITKTATSSPKTSSESEASKKSSIHQRADSVFRSPLSPASVNSQFTPPPSVRRRDSTGVRKLLSLASLRKSFAASTTSLSPSSSPSNGYQSSYVATPVSNYHSSRPSSPSVYSISSPIAYTGPNPFEASNPTSPSAVPRSQPQLRKRKSGSWFRRKSLLFMMDGDAFTESDEVLQVHEIQTRSVSTPITRNSVYSPPPVLPEMRGTITGGAFAGEDVFTTIGR